MASDSHNSILPTSQNESQVFWHSAQAQGSDRKGMIYQSEAMSHLMKVAEKISPSMANVLVLGESGTGKELLARYIHDNSNRKNKPFVAINCGALQDTLLESELFGHEKGSFTGAFQKKLGLAEVADGGTLFLDEIGEMAPSIQAKLLRFLQEGEIFRVGGKESVKVDVRIVCATNRDLEKEVSKGKFREDLYYRINTIVMQIPPLRRRKEDIPLLAYHFLANVGHGTRRLQVSEEAMKVLLEYGWPGNIRELQNICERLLILCEGHSIMASDLPEQIRHPELADDHSDYDPALGLGELERRWILKALTYFDGNKTQAAQALGITIKTLYNKLHEYGEFKNFAVHNRDLRG